MVTELLHHLALFCPRLKYFRVSEQTREIANFLWMDYQKKREISDVLNGLSQNCLFIARFKDKLDHTGFDNCNLNVEDARRLILDIKSNIFGNTRSWFVVCLLKTFPKLFKIDLEWWWWSIIDNLFGNYQILDDDQWKKNIFRTTTTRCTFFSRTESEPSYIMAIIIRTCMKPKEREGR